MKSPSHNVLPVLYERLRLRLEQEYRDLQHRIDRTERQLLFMGVHNAESPGSSDQEVLIDRSRHYRQRLKLVVQGLQRIREGTFGLCESCEEPIGQKRLEALPTAHYCIKCQEELEQTGYSLPSALVAPNHQNYRREDADSMSLPGS